MNRVSPRLEHIGIAVADASHTAEVLKKVLGLPVYKMEEVASEHVRTHFLSAGTTKLELLEATAPDSPIAKFLEKNREGLHHLAFEVEDIDGAWARTKEAGLEVLGAGPKPGADGKRIFFLHPRSTGGILIEFCTQQPVTLSPRVIEADGVPITTYTAGRTDAPALLLLPDAGQPVHPELAGLAHAWAATWRVIVMEATGEWTHPVEATRTVHAVMDAHGVWGASVIGWGWGAAAGMQVALEAPARVHALVAHAPRGVPAGGFPAEIPLLLSALDADPAFTPADAVRMLDQYPNARLAISPERAWDVAHPALGWLANIIKSNR